MLFSFTSHIAEGIPVFTLNGNLLEKNQAIELTEKMDEMFEGGKNSMVIDLTGVKHLSSSGINILISALTRCRKHGGEAVLCGISESLKKLFLITKLETVFTIYPNTETAVRELTANNTSKS